MSEKNNPEEIKILIQQLSKQLDVIVALLLRLIPKDINSLSFKNQVRILNDLNIRPVDIAKITGRTQSYVNKELVSIRREK